MGKRLLFVLATLTTLSGLFYSCEQAVEVIDVTSITISQPSAEMIIGESITLSATVSPSNATDQEVTWASSQQSVATVDNSGVVTALAAGEAIISATTHNAKMSDKCSVVVFAPSVTVDADNISISGARLKGEAHFSSFEKNIEYGFAYGTSASVMVANPQLVYSNDLGSDNYYSASVSELTPNTTYYFRSFLYKKGELFYGDTKSFNTAIAVSSIKLNKDTMSLCEGQQDRLTVIISPENAYDKTVSWSSSDNSVATIDQDGFIKAVSKGKTIIKAVANDGSGVLATCSLDVIRLVSNIELELSTPILYPGKKNSIKATVTPNSANNTSVSWSSSNSSVVSVSNSGVVSGIALGSAEIIASANDGSGVKASCTIEVKQNVISLVLNKESIVLNEGDSAEISVSTINPVDAYDKSYSWISSNENIVKINDNGVITAISEGSSSIKAIANDECGAEAICSIKVLPKGAVDLGLSVYWHSCNVGATSPEQYGNYYAWGEIEPKDVYTVNNYRWYGGSWDSYIKYCPNDNRFIGSRDGKLSLDAADDAAHVLLGRKWRIPTMEELSILHNQCEWIWCTKNGINGYEVKSLINGNSIFLPAGGSGGETGFINVESGGYYWSREIKIGDYGSSPAKTLFFGSSGVYEGSSMRHYGYLLRPVYGK